MAEPGFQVLIFLREWDFRPVQAERAEALSRHAKPGGLIYPGWMISTYPRDSNLCIRRETAIKRWYWRVVRAEEEPGPEHS